jgi:hypothetical protein
VCGGVLTGVWIENGVDLFVYVLSVLVSLSVFLFGISLNLSRCITGLLSCVSLFRAILKETFGGLHADRPTPLQSFSGKRVSNGLSFESSLTALQILDRF